MDSVPRREFAADAGCDVAFTEENWNLAKAESNTRRSRWYYSLALVIFAAGEAGFLLAFLSRPEALAGSSYLAEIIAGRGADLMLIGFAMSFGATVLALAIAAYAYLMSRRDDAEQ
jgi:hypothetical protein